MRDGKLSKVTLETRIRANVRKNGGPCSTLRYIFSSRMRGNIHDVQSSCFTFLFPFFLGRLLFYLASRTMQPVLPHSFSPYQSHDFLEAVHLPRRYANDREFDREYFLFYILHDGIRSQPIKCTVSACVRRVNRFHYDECVCAEVEKK